MSVLIKNGLIVTDTVSRMDILTSGSRIIEVAPVIDCEADELIDASGKYVFPGLVDLHCHLREPGYEYKEDISSGTRAALNGGFTSLAVMPNTNPPVDTAWAVYAQLARAAECDNARVYPTGCITKGRSGKELSEIGLMKDAGIVAVTDDGSPVSDGALLLNAMRYAATFDVLVMCHCEDMSLSGGGVAHEGYNAAVAGLKGIPAVSESTCVARDIALAEVAGARIHIMHVSTKETVDVIRQAKSRGARVTAETCPHYFAATDEEILSFNTNAKINPPLRAEDDADAVIQGLIDGTIDAIATDHAPHHADEKALEFNYAPSGTSGLETAFAVSYTHLVKAGHISLEKLCKLMSTTPAEILSIPAGTLEVGAFADIIVVDLDKEFTVNPQAFVSKGKNSVFAGWKLYGTVTDVLVNGKYKEIRKQ